MKKKKKGKKGKRGEGGEKVIKENTLRKNKYNKNTMGDKEQKKGKVENRSRKKKYIYI